jgi:hypothetical protein
MNQPCTCPIHGTVAALVNLPGRATLFCEACYDAGAETTVVVRLDHNVPGVNCVSLAMRMWRDMERQHLKSLATPFSVEPPTPGEDQ